jgi:hypothetical protein
METYIFSNFANQMNRYIKILFLFLFVEFLFLNTSAQDDEINPNRGFGYWDLGINFGMYWPSNYHARFYDGSESNVNKMSYVFGNQYWYDDIYNELNAADTVFVKELPTNMRYTPAFQVGFYFRRTFDNYFGISLQFDYSKLTAADKFSVEVDPGYIAQEPDIRLYDIWGIEERVNIDLLVSRYFKLKNPMFIPFFEGGLNISSTRVKENKIRIETLEYSLVDVYLSGSYVPGTPQNEYVVQQGGLGLGLSATFGVKMKFNDQVSVDPGFRVYFQKIKLENYDLMKPAFSIFIRLSLTDFFTSYE